MSHGECPPEIARSCEFFERTGECFTDVHHLYYPRSDYRAGVEKAFREMPENKVILPRCEHNETHAAQLKPDKPSREFMFNALKNVVRPLDAA